MAVITLTTENFNSETKEGKVLIDFWAPWCGPCKMMGPIIDEVANEVNGVKIAKVNVDDYPALASKYNVMSIPTLVVLENGVEMKKSVGAISKDKVKDLIG